MAKKRSIEYRINDLNYSDKLLIDCTALNTLQIAKLIP